MGTARPGAEAPSRNGNGTLGRVGWAALAGAALAALLHLLTLVAAAYGRFAEAGLERLPDPRVATAARLGAALSPWSARRAALHGWVQAQAGEREAAARSYERALVWAPADALLWTEYALALGRGGQFDARFLLATRRALALAPASPAVRSSVARMGLAYWRRGGPELRELWLESMRWQLDHSRYSFLSDVDEQGHRLSFCLHHAGPLGESAWCRGEG